MTKEEREEAIYQLERCIHNAKVSGNKYSHFELAIEALKVEPCEDAISREPFTDSTICEGISCNECSFNRKDKGGCILEERVMRLPSIQPQPKTGQWIPQEMETYIDGKLKHWKAYKCNKCDNLLTDDYEYCPHCGAKMVEPQETETWNGIHAQITAPKGTFERIFNDADDDNEI